jgi:hypothetical protein
VFLTKDHDIGTLIHRDRQPHSGMLLVDDLGDAGAETRMILSAIASHWRSASRRPIRSAAPPRIAVIRARLRSWPETASALPRPIQSIRMPAGPCPGWATIGPAPTTVPALRRDQPSDLARRRPFGERPMPAGSASSAVPASVSAPRGFRARQR